MDRTFGWHKKLRKTDDFSSVFHFRCTWRGQVLDLSAGPNTLPHGRLGMIVPKKRLHRAVDRNRTKRLLREWFRIHQDSLAGLDIIARLRAGGNTGPLDETTLEKEFLDGLEAARACVSRRQAATRPPPGCP